LKCMNRFDLAYYLAVSILIAIGSYLLFYEPAPVLIANNFSGLKVTDGKWQFIREEGGRGYLGVEGADVEYSATYRNSSGCEILLHIAYYEYQTQGKEIIQYKAEWLHYESDILDIKNTGLINEMKVRKIIYKDGKKNKMSIYWYDINGRITSNAYETKMISGIDGIIHGTTNGAVVFVTIDIDSQVNHGREQEEAHDFIISMYPAIRKAISAKT